MEELLLKIIDRLETIPEINYSDENWGQLLNYGSDIPVRWPCALVHIMNGQFTNNGYSYMKDSLEQEGVLSIEITVGNLKLTNTSGKAPITQRTKGVSIYSHVKKVHEALQNWKPDENSGAMVRSSFQSVLRDDGVQEKRIVYTIGLHGC